MKYISALILIFTMIFANLSYSAEKFKGLSKEREKEIISHVTNNFAAEANMILEYPIKFIWSKYKFVVTHKDGKKITVGDTYNPNYLIYEIDIDVDLLSSKPGSTKTEHNYGFKVIENKGKLFVVAESGGMR